MKTKNAAVDADEVIRQVGMEITEDGTEIQHFEQVSTRSTAVSLAETLQITYPTAAELLAEAVVTINEH